MRRGGRLSPQSARKHAADVELAAARETVEARARGLCELNTPACPTGPHRGNQAHHRLMRAHTSGHDPALMSWVCTASHNFLHANPALAYENGWLVRGVR